MAALIFGMDGGGGPRNKKETLADVEVRNGGIAAGGGL